MSRFYMTGEEERGYKDRESEGRYSSYPHSGSHEYREGWDERERDERRERDRQEERREEEAARERAEERAQLERAMMRREEEQQEEQQQEIAEDPPPVRCDQHAEDPHECKNCGGYGVVSLNPDTPPNPAPGGSTVACEKCNGMGIEPAEDPHEKSESRAGIQPFESNADREGARP